ncbi:hypothetical protein [Amycolatopsis magusensis]|uniref:Uncharacterized protein n=1 Tax=Amycolatopsis magusensis TaxID=882444 RepID=A0ABS4PU22_9PSEU|nr:hypothetical protein [Amycolatopsis magusensis]MBP2182928.1 hypothetical protein [Amycolatopsis magusensis]
MRTDIESRVQAFPVDLSAYFNNTGATAKSDLARGRLNVWQNSFPAEELPDAGIFVATSVPFEFPAIGPGRHDNIRCAGQRVELPAGRWDWIYLLACSERRSEDVLQLHYTDGTVDAEWLRVSDFWPASPPHFGEVEAIRCEQMHFPRHIQPRVGPRIWQQRVPVPRQHDLAALRLPDNIAIHVFAMTLVNQGLG